ncbi:hypothetical protein DM02DRAFT_660063 [Periconia macrospinosa]|uniref:Uncharacterized protein n=1 Tax=Periconia macrospinosa TaxID=97972 RepID=A0A2V1DBL0_9PLEO|nr:hypothetical protein DM02DRAFT_660063 [Periconia macrospinosa]
MDYCKSAPLPPPPPPPRLSWRLRAALNLDNLGILSVKSPKTNIYYQTKHDYLTGIYYMDKGRNLKRRKSLCTNQPSESWSKAVGMRRRKKKFSDQTASPLISKLPFEVRERIYEFALTVTGAVFIHVGRVTMRRLCCAAVSGFLVDCAAVYVPVSLYRNAADIVLQDAVCVQ